MFFRKIAKASPLGASVLNSLRLILEVHTQCPFGALDVTLKKEKRHENNAQMDEVSVEGTYNGLSLSWRIVMFWSDDLRCHIPEIVPAPLIWKNIPIQIAFYHELYGVVGTKIGAREWQIGSSFRDVQKEAYSFPTQ